MIVVIFNFLNNLNLFLGGMVEESCWLSINLVVVVESCWLSINLVVVVLFSLC